jgi:hypothetical protein
MGEAEPTADDVPLRSVHTSNFPQLLSEAASSVLVTTYQAGKLVILRNDGGVLNTHFRSFPKPMGLAVTGGRLAVGTSAEIWEFHNVPAVCRRLDAAAEPSPSGRGQGEGEAGTRVRPHPSPLPEREGGCSPHCRVTVVHS